ncbi:Laccase domain protein [Saliniradius amylolyticus]|uniref:Purine nucleoside phosphorylase n=1 Tax=Saliniradius amylolyticus TaxID=2183582 RepID=A0A2S2E4X4_9ALTE|nr:peptidoglycan editing factor PgeF [Saliniradius amylolyticus]AWL12649.1 Laccase domain protein [Saliniradius amylolyticus]
MITPNWPAPTNVQTFCTVRQGGYSAPPYDSLNIAGHVGDDPTRVAKNRHLLPNYQNLVWLEQVHGNHAVELKAGQTVDEPADASISRTPGVGCVVMTADCLPMLVCDERGSVVAAVHGGWRGLAAGVIANTIKKMAVPGEQLMVWLGPAIGPDAFEVGEEVLDHFIDCKTAFRKTAKPGKYLADIYQIARHQLQALGVQRCYGGNDCTFSDASRFFSYRRDGQTGRMASAIWLT